MKIFLFLFATIFSLGTVEAQAEFPYFLKGTWKIEHSTNYEHWDSLHLEELRGFTYSLKGEKLLPSEYLTLVKKGKKTTLNATVIGQNNGKSIQFTQQTFGDSVEFVNLKHDFPQRICYHLISPTTIRVSVLGKNAEGFSYYMHAQKAAQKDHSILNENYDSTLAKRLNADVYGMKKYILVLLKTGTNTTKDEQFTQEKFEGHMQNIERLVKDSSLIIAGPFFNNAARLRGLFILNVETTEAAEKILQTDPAINSQLLSYEMYPWYGSAALATYLDFSDKIWRQKP